MFQKKRNFIIIAITVTIIIYWLLCIPYPLFNEPYSTVIYDKHKEFSGAIIAADGQWRFNNLQPLPEKVATCIVLFEDEYFYYHPGINPVSISRAIWQNLKNNKIISGGSTISMQTIRLARKNKRRNIFEKFIEVVWATRLELSYSKKEILQLYVNHAPYGGNIVGLETAAQKYFGRSSENLSWAEAALLAVLPNAPSLIFPGKNQHLLIKKRNLLLTKLYRKKNIDKLTYTLSCAEPLPDKILPFPKHAPHLLTRIHAEKRGELVYTTLENNLQNKITGIISKHSKLLKQNGIQNMSALVLDVETNLVLAYVGNSPEADKDNEKDVDIIIAPRSPGSTLKPLLYASMLDEGSILSNMLVPDIPTQISGYSPKNFDLEYDGAIPAKRALARSLNVPAVKMLQEHGIEKFHLLLNKKIKFSTIQKSANHYGLSIILGGAENSMWELAGCYASMARTLNNYTKYNGKYNIYDFSFPNYIEKKHNTQLSTSYPVFSAGAIYQTFEALAEVNRPDLESGWINYSSNQKIAWKTGTSFGFRDAWAIGITPKYVVAVWAGNADGEGRTGLTGIASAAPALFDIFSSLPTSAWFTKPFDEFEKTLTCKQSGFKASTNCPETDTTEVLPQAIKSKTCPFHTLIHLDNTGLFRVNSQCENPENMLHKAWFVLPPVIEFYFTKRNPWYQKLPPYHSNCNDNNGKNSMELIYPRETSRIYIPKELDGKPGKVIFEVAHRNTNTTIFWHLNNSFMGSTKNIHQFATFLTSGKYTLTLIDENGETLIKNITIENK
jgi:penicillin-binding protein 1C